MLRMPIHPVGVALPALLARRVWRVLVWRNDPSTLGEPEPFSVWSGWEVQ